MKRNLSFVILLVGIICATSHNIPENDTEHNEVEGKYSDQNLTPYHIVTVQTEVETNKTMTGAVGQGRELVEGRTFAIKRLQFMLLPVMYKLGVMSTLLVTLVVLTLKSLLIGIILLVIKVGSFIASLKHPHYEHSAPAQSWSPPWPQPQAQPVHIHLHNSGDPHHPHEYHGAYVDRYDQQVQYQVPSGWASGSSPSSNPYEKGIAIDNYGQYIFKG